MPHLCQAIMTFRMKTDNEMFPILNRLIFAAILVAGFCAKASAEADGPDYWRVVGVSEGDTLNIRAKPNARSEKLGEIPSDGNCISNRGCQGGLSFAEYSTLSESDRALRLKQHPRWCKIDYKGVTGWVAGRYLAEGNCP